MARKINKGEEVVYKLPFNWPVVVTVVECLPRGKFYVINRYAEEVIVPRRLLVLLPKKYRFLQVGEAAYDRDEWRSPVRWLPINFNRIVTRADTIRRLR